MTRKRGNLRLIRAVTDSPLTRPLTDLLAVTYGPLPVLSDLLAKAAASPRRTSTAPGPRDTTANPAQRRRT